MGAQIFAGMAGFADSFAKTYGAETRRQSDEEDRKEKRAWMQEQQARQRSDWKEQDALKSDLKSAATQVSMEQGAGGMVKPDTMDNRDVGLPENDAQPNSGLMPGQYKVGGQTFVDKTQAEKAVTDHNAPDAIAQRTVQAYQKNGQVEKAMTMENGLLDQQSKRLGLSIDQLKHADMVTNRALDSALKSESTWYEGAAKFATDAQRGGMKDIKAKTELSADGKTVTMKAVMPDGSEQVAGIYATDDSGRLEFMRKFSSLPIEKRMDIMADKIKSDQTQSNWEKTFNQADDHFKITKAFQEKQLSLTAGHLLLAKSDDARKQALFDQESKVPSAVNKAYDALKEQAKVMDTAIYKAQAEGTFKEGEPNAVLLLDKRVKLTADMNKLMNPYIQAAQSKLPASNGSTPPTNDVADIRGKSPATTMSSTSTSPSETKKAVTMQQVAPVAAPRPATVSEALNPGGNVSLSAVVQPKAQAIETLTAQLKQEQAALAQVAGSNPQAAIAQAQKVQGIRNAINQHLEGMNPDQAALVLKAAGI